MITTTARTDSVLVVSRKNNYLRAVMQEIRHPRMFPARAPYAFIRDMFETQCLERDYNLADICIISQYLDMDSRDYVSHHPHLMSTLVESDSSHSAALGQLFCHNYFRCILEMSNVDYDDDDVDMESYEIVFHSISNSITELLSGQSLPRHLTLDCVETRSGAVLLWPVRSASEATIPEDEFNDSGYESAEEQSGLFKMFDKGLFAKADNTLNNFERASNTINDLLEKSQKFTDVSAHLERLSASTLCFIENGCLIAFVVSGIEMTFGSNSAMARPVFMFSTAVLIYLHKGEIFKYVTKAYDYVRSCFEGPQTQGVDWTDFLRCIIPVWGVASGIGIFSIGTNVERFIRSSGSLDKNMSGLSATISSVISLFESLANFVVVDIFGGKTLSFLTADSTRVIAWAKSVSDFYMATKAGTITLRSSNQMTLNRFELTGRELMLDPKITDSRRNTYVIDRTMRVLQELLLVYQGGGMSRDVMRMRPVTIYFKGESGTGKSFGVIPLMQHVYLQMCTSNEEARAFEANLADYTYNIVSEDDFYSGFKGQPMANIDDLGQLVSVPGGGANSEGMRVIRLVNNFAFNTPQAVLELKGRVPFTSEVLTATSNKWLNEDPAMTYPKAFRSRWDLCVEVRVKEKYTNLYNGQIAVEDHGIWKDHPEIKGKFNRDLYDYVIHPCFPKDNMSQEKRKVLDFEELVGLIVSKWKARREDFGAVNDDIRAQLSERRRQMFNAEQQSSEGERYLDMFNIFDRASTEQDSGSDSGLSDTDDESDDWEPDSGTSMALAAVAEQKPDQGQLYWRVWRDTFVKYSGVVYWPHTCEMALSILGGEGAVINSMNDFYRLESKPQYFYEAIRKWAIRMKVKRDKVGDTLYKWQKIIQMAHESPNAEDLEAQVDDLINERKKSGSFLRVFMDENPKFVNFCKIGIPSMLLLAGCWKLYSMFTSIESPVETIEMTTSSSTINVKEQSGDCPVISQNILMPESIAMNEIETNFCASNSVHTTAPQDGWESRDQVSHDLFLSLLRRNVYRVSFGAASLGYALAVAGTTFIMPSHFLATAANMSGGHVDPKWSFASMERDGNKSFTVFSEDDFLHSAHIPGKDTFIFDVNRKVCSEHRDIMHHFISRAELTSFPTIFRILSLTGGHVPVLNLVPANTFKCVPYGSHKLLIGAIGYHSPTKKGDCGAPVLLNSKSTSGKILGIHTAGYAHKEVGYCPLLTKETIEEWRAILVPCLASEQSGHWLTDAGFDVLYEVPQHLRSNCSPLSKIVRSRMYGVFESKKRPGVLGTRIVSGVTRDPLRQAIERYSPRAPAAFSEEALRMSFEIMRSIDVASDISCTNAFQTHSLHSAVYGNSAYDYFEAMPRHTSPGKYWKDLMRNLKGYQGKEGVMGKPDDVPCTAPYWEHFAARVDHFYKKLAVGDQVDCVIEDFLKDECVSFEKYDSFKTRLICGWPMCILALFIMCYRDWARFVQRNRVLNSSLVGVNVYSADYDLFCKVMQSRGTKTISIDAKSFDCSHDKRVLEIMYDCYIAPMWANDTDSNNNVRRGLWALIMDSTHIMRDTVYRWRGGLPSGVFLTLLLNSACSRAYVCYSWVRACYANDTCGMIEHFDMYVAVVAVGDDIVINVSDHVAQWFNAHTIRQYAAELGYLITSDKKDSELEPYREGLDFAFLKRTPCWNSVRGRFVGALDLDTVRESLQWTIRGADSVNVTKAKVELFFLELSLHGREVFDKLAPRVIQFSRQKLGWVPAVISWNHCVRMITNHSEMCYLNGKIYNRQDLEDVENFSSQIDDFLLPIVPQTGDFFRFTSQYALRAKENAITQSGNGIVKLDAPSDFKSSRGLRNRLADNPNQNIMGVAVTPKTDGKIADFHEQPTIKDITFKERVDIPQGLKNTLGDGADHTVKDFLTRPVAIYSSTWGDGVSMSTRIMSLKLPSDLIKYGPWMEKLKAFKGFRPGMIKLRWQVNGTRQHQGILRGSIFYNPKHTLKYRTVISSPHLFSTLPHVDFNVSTDSDVVMHVPYVNDQLYYDLTEGGRDYAQFDLWVYSPLKSIALQSLDVTLFASFEDVELEFPTIPSLAQPQSGRAYARGDPAIAELDASDRPLSSGLARMSLAARALAKIPLMSDVATPAAWALEAASGAARAFGFSNPLSTPSPNVINKRPVPYGPNFAGEDLSYNLGLDSSNSLEHAIGLGTTAEDELAFDHFCRIPSYYKTIDWGTQALGDLLAAYDISPLNLVGTSTATNPAGTMSQVALPSPMAYVAMNALQWRGCIDLRFKFAKTEFHTGRLLFAFSPNMQGTASLTDYSSMSYLHREIVDIRNTTEFTFTVPFASTTPYKQLRTGASTTAIGTEFSDDYWWGKNNVAATCVGRVFIFVINKLKAPLNVTQTVEIKVEVNAGDGFEVAGFAQNYNFPCYNNAVPAIVTQTYIGNPVIQCAEIQSAEVEGDVIDDAVLAEVGAPIGGVTCPSVGEYAARYCVGERIHSIRQILKRSVLFYAYGPFNNKDNIDTFKQTRTTYAAPWTTTGWTLGDPSYMTNRANIRRYIDFIDLFAGCFAYQRGSIRLKHLNVTGIEWNMTGSIAPIPSNGFFALLGYTNLIASPVTNITGGIWGHCYPSAPMPKDGVLEMQIPYIAVTPMTTIEVTTQNEFSGSDSTGQPNFLAVVNTRPDLRISSDQWSTWQNEPIYNCYRSAGEDHSFIGFNGLPFIALQQFVMEGNADKAKLPIDLF